MSRSSLAGLLLSSLLPLLESSSNEDDEGNDNIMNDADRYNRWMIRNATSIISGWKVGQ